ncbi:hypothetical protein EJB05_22969, partial [Eragrostis curvula]
MARLPLKTPTTPVGNAGQKRKHEECHKAHRRLMDKQHQELATLKKEAKEADAARKSRSDEIECLKK